MMTKNYLTRSEVVVFFVSLLIFGGILGLRVRTDIQNHAQFVKDVADGSLSPPANFLYYLVIYFFAAFTTNMHLLYGSSLLVLTLSVTAKFSITRVMSTQYYKSVRSFNAAVEALIYLACGLLLFAFSLPNGKTFYLGQIPPNVWHNSTTIFVMPFALGLFWLSFEQLVRPTTSRVVAIAVLCVANVLIKPSYFFVFVLSYPLMLLKQFGLGRELWRNLVPVVIGSVTTCVLYYLIYKLSYGNIQGGEAGIAIRPLSVWSHFSSNILLSLILSLVFPLVYLGLYWTDLIKNMILQYAVLSYSIAVTLYSLLSETGPRELHGNFFWQCVICSYLLFAVTTALSVEKIELFGWHYWKNRLVILAFLSHVVAGAIYLARCFYAKSGLV